MTDTDALAMTTLMKHYPELWIKRQMDNELWLADVRDSSPMIEWLITLGSFIVFGAIPLIPYLFFDNIDYRISSLIMTALALITLGVARRYVTKMNFIKTVGQMVILWAVAAGVAYWTGHLVMKFQ
jgi:VIT1/CCC1 family predicted Fe2+/Mn2+ transporter